MPVACGCSIAEKNGARCPSHGFAEKLEEEARRLVVAVDHKSRINAAMARIQAVFDDIKAAKRSWNK